VRLRDSASSEQLGAVRGLQGIRSAAMADGVLQVGADEPETVAPDVVRALVRSGADLVEVRAEQASLERVYFEIMGVTPGADSLEDHV
jgi:hypothetical protein